MESFQELLINSQIFLYIVQVLVAVALIGFILIQQGKGADAGASFGGGASGTVFGAAGGGNFFTKVTTILATVFLVNSLLLGYIATQRMQAPETSLMSEVEQAIQEAEVIESNDVPAAIEEAATDSDIPAIPE